MDNGAMDICRQKGSSIKYSPKGALVFLSLTVGIYLAIFVGFVEKGQTASYPSLLSGYQDIDTPYSTGRDDIQMGGFFTAVGMVF